MIAASYFLVLFLTLGKLFVPLLGPIRLAGKMAGDDVDILWEKNIIILLKQYVW